MVQLACLSGAVDCSIVGCFGDRFLKRLVLLLYLLCPLALYGQAFVSGELKINTRWFGEIVVEGDVIVPRGITLSIEPGTRILVRANQDRLQSGKDPRKIEIIVSGTLLANGIEQGGEILFTSSSVNPGVGDWHGIVLKNRSKPSVLRSCIVEYAYKGVTSYGSAPHITDSEIRFNEYAGISCEIRSAARIDNCVLVRNDFAGLLCELASSPVVQRTVIKNNGNGIIIFDRSQPDLGRINPPENASVGENEIAGNREKNIYNQSSQVIYAENNIWETNDVKSIAANIFDGEDDSIYGTVDVSPLFRNRSPRVGDGFSRVRKGNVASSQARRSSDDLSASPVGSEGITGTNGDAVTSEDLVNTGPIDSLSSEMVNQNAAGAAAILAGKLATRETGGDNAADGDFPALDSAVFRPADNTANTTTTKREPLPIITQPVFESMLDGKQRVYLNRVLPTYPEVYKKLAYEGLVQMEVTVGRDGAPENIRIIRSTAKFFTEAARKAIADTRYKPGTVQGQIVRFKVFESFLFRSEN